MCSPPDPERFRAAAVALVDAAEASHGWLYDTIDSAGNSGKHSARGLVGRVGLPVVCNEHELLGRLRPSCTASDGVDLHVP